MHMAPTPIRLFPYYDTDSVFDLDQLVDAIKDGSIDAIMFDLMNRKDEFEMGTLSMPLTKPVNKMRICAMIDLTSDIPSYVLRVDDDNNDGFMNIKSDATSVQKVVDAIKTQTMPLYNVTPKKQIAECDFVLQT